MKERAFGAAIKGEVNDPILNWLLHSNVIHGCEWINRRRRSAAALWPFAQPFESKRVSIDEIIIRETESRVREQQSKRMNIGQSRWFTVCYARLRISKFTAHSAMTLVGNWFCFCCESKYIKIQNSSFSLHCFSF